MKVFAFAASLRQGSNNQQLIELAARLAQRHGAQVTLADYAELVCPNYSFDDQQAGFPAQAERLKALFDEHDAVMISSPEYNYSIPGALKNALDWASRYRPVPTAGKHAYLLSASPSLVGGNRGLWATRQPLEVMGVHVYPGMFSLAASHEAFTPEGELKDAKLQERLSDEIAQFVKLVTTLKG